jgi:hypothetical protein
MIGRQAGENLRRLRGGLARAEDHLGESEPKRSVVVELGVVPRLFVGKRAQVREGLVDRLLAPR